MNRRKILNALRPDKDLASAQTILDRLKKRVDSTSLRTTLQTVVTFDRETGNLWMTLHRMGMQNAELIPRLLLRRSTASMKKAHAIANDINGVIAARISKAGPKYSRKDKAAYAEIRRMMHTILFRAELSDLLRTGGMAAVRERIRQE